MAIAVTRLTPVFAARIEGADLTRPLDEPTWAWHLGQHDYSTWARQHIKDEELAGALAAVERAGLPPAESRRRALDEIRSRYTV